MLGYPSSNKHRPCQLGGLEFYIPLQDSQGHRIAELPQMMSDIKGLMYNYIYIYNYQFASEPDSGGYTPKF